MGANQDIPYVHLLKTKRVTMESPARSIEILSLMSLPEIVEAINQLLIMTMDSSLQFTFNTLGFVAELIDELIIEFLRLLP